MEVAPANRRRIELAVFLTAFAAYLCATLVFRWLREPLFEGVGADGWPAPSLGELAYLVYMTCLPVALWLLVSYAGARRLPYGWGMRVMFVVFLLVLAVVEIDNTWYGMSGHHGTWREAHLFLTENWALHYGIRPTDEHGFLVRMAKHLLRLIVLFLAAHMLARWKRAQRYFTASLGRGIAVILVLVVGDLLLSGYRVTRGDDQWKAVADANPFRIHPLDRLSEHLFSFTSDDHADLVAANEAFAKAIHDATAERPDSTSSRTLSPEPVRSADAQYNVVVVTIEGVNARLSDSTTMPFWQQLAAKSTSLRNHYSTGNVTEYGVLGLLYGAPPDFYRGTGSLPWRHQLPSAKQPPQPGSPYISEFARHGYHTRLISWELSSWAQLGLYLQNFDEPAFESNDDWKLLPELSHELQAPGPHFVYMHYNGTHFPYEHAAAYARFQPEVPSDFDYTSGRMHAEAAEITNRYRNCLLELDAWLQALVGDVDMQHTILVLTGDHGEEFFEHSRLGHSSTLDAPQIRTIALIYVPGQPPRVINTVTSHADFMPTLVDYLGWRDPSAPFGRSLARDVNGASAIVAMGNRPNPPVRWAAVAGSSKAILVEGDDDSLHIVRLADTDDHRLTYRADPTRWRASFAAAAKLQLHLRDASSPARIAAATAPAP